VPYASSRLTRLLEQGLGGNSVTLWITTLDASPRNSADSLHSLEVGDKIRRIKNAARVNKNTIATTIRELREEIKRARGRLQLSQPGTYMHDIDPQQLKILKQLIAELERVKAHTWEKVREHRCTQASVHFGIGCSAALPFRCPPWLTFFFSFRAVFFVFVFFRNTLAVLRCTSLVACLWSRRACSTP